MSAGKILVVEDEMIARRVLRDLLVHVGHDVTTVSSGEEAIEQLDAEHYDLVLTDLQLRKVDGLAVVAAARERDPDVEAIVLTGYATLDSAIAAVRQGATNYILKPGQPGEIESSVSTALARRA
ncbi:MAG: response regulator, partial [Chloroflexales bacterium]|nr:response regulator [Chloroflexales bacterium]